MDVPISIRGAQTLAVLQGVLGTITVFIGLIAVIIVGGSLGGALGLGLVLLGVAFFAVPLILLVAAVSLGGLERWAQVSLYLIELLVIAASSVVIILSAALGVLSIVVAVGVLLFLSTPATWRAIARSRDATWRPAGAAASPWGAPTPPRPAGPGAEDDDRIWDPGASTPEPSIHDLIGYWRDSLRRGKLN